MDIIIEMHIKAILFGVDETVINNLDIGNDYCIKKDTLINQALYQEFDYQAINFRRMYDSAKLNDQLEIAVLSKKYKKKYIATIKDGKIYFYENKELSELIFELEEQEITYIDKKMRAIRLYNENGYNIKELLINTKFIYENNDKITYNSRIPFPDRLPITITKLSLKNEHEIKCINEYLEKFDFEFKTSQYKPEILESACSLYDQSYYAPVDTLKFMVCVIGLESLLVDGNTELSYRLSRNCAMLLSDNIEQYNKLFLKTKEIYNKRSQFVHTGKIKNFTADDILDARSMLRKVIFKIIELNERKEDLLKKLDLKGYIMK